MWNVKQLPSSMVQVVLQLAYRHDAAAMTSMSVASLLMIPLPFTIHCIVFHQLHKACQKAILAPMTIGIYGLGRFGHFWASTIRRMSPESVRVVATSRSWHEPPAGVDFLTEDDFLSSVDVLFFTVAISSFEEVLKRVADRVRKDTLVLDTCSVKAEPARWMEEKLDSAIQLVASHPMFGPDSAKDGLAGLPMVLCPLRVDDDKFSWLKDLFTSWGLKVLVMTPLQHDRQAAYSQGVTHFVGRTLREMGLEDTEIATRGYKALMSIVEQTCNDPMQLFYDLQHYNPYAREMRLSLQVALEKTLNHLRESEEGKV